jgi:hypothetical protein
MCDDDRMWKGIVLAVCVAGAACGDGESNGGADAAVDGGAVDAAFDAGLPDARIDAAPPIDAGPFRSGTIVPLYTYPTDPSWSALIAAKTAHPTVPVVAIVNPNSGPGALADPQYVSGISSLASAGIQVVGYVPTNYAARQIADVEMDLILWDTFYGDGMVGIFFDEQSNDPADVPYYTDASSRAANHGLPFTIGNPGTDTDPAYVGSVDVILIYESAGLPLVDSLGGWHDTYPRENFGVIPYAVPPPLDTAFVDGAELHVGWIYLTDDDLPNPWDSLPPYFDQLLGALE